ncbi:MAG: haloacid dehalogenase-like hydrolase [Pirellulaceae bacterium]|nr:haloacid dehalogenase-like hydrolase [Pirellulaceae bacterium]
MLVLLFDIDGTLVDARGAGGTSLRTAFADVFDVVEPAKVPFSGRTDRGIAREMFLLHGIADTNRNFQALQWEYLTRLPNQLQLSGGVILPGVGELLERLSQNSDVIMGLLTGNMFDGARLKLNYFGLFSCFAFGAFGDTAIDRNEVARQALRLAFMQCNAVADEVDVWVIGDTPLDIQCARAIDAKVLAVGTGIHPLDELESHRPDVLLEDLHDCHEVLRVLYG